MVLLIDCNSKAGGTEMQAGKNKIDGIFISHSIEINKCGYLPFDYFPSNHRGLWIDIIYTKVFGFLTDKSVRPNSRRLKTNNVQVVRKWQQIYSDYLEEHGLKTTKTRYRKFKI